MRATIVFDRTQPGWCNVEIRVDADSRDEAQTEIERLFEMIVSDRGCFVRVKPEADTYTDYDTKITSHRGYARFMLSDGKGARRDSQYLVQKVEFAKASPVAQ